MYGHGIVAPNLNVEYKLYEFKIDLAANGQPTTGERDSSEPVFDRWLRVTANAYRIKFDRRDLKMHDGFPIASNTELLRSLVENPFDANEFQAACTRAKNDGLAIITNPFDGLSQRGYSLGGYDSIEIVMDDRGEEFCLCPPHRSPAMQMSVLHFAAFLGITEAVNILCEQHPKLVNTSTYPKHIEEPERDLHFLRPIDYAAARGHDGIVTVLRARGSVEPKAENVALLQSFSSVQHSLAAPEEAPPEYSIEDPNSLSAEENLGSNAQPSSQVEGARPATRGIRRLLECCVVS